MIRLRSLVLLLISQGLVILCLVTSCQSERHELKFPLDYNSRFYPIAIDDLVVIPSIDIDSHVVFQVLDVENYQTYPIATELESHNLKSYYNLLSAHFQHELFIPFSGELISLDLSKHKLDNIKLIRHLQPFLGHKNDLLVYTTHHAQASETTVLSLRNRSQAPIKISNPHRGDTVTHLLHAFPIINGVDTTICQSIIEFAPSEYASNYVEFIDYPTLTSRKKLITHPDTLFGFGVVHPAVIQDSMSFWVTNSSILAIDLIQQKILWEYPHQSSMITSRLVLHDSVVYAALDDGKVLALNSHTGQPMWVATAAATPGRISIDNDRLYVISGVTQKLYVINIYTGDLLGISEPNLVSGASEAAQKQYELSRLLHVQDNVIIFVMDSSWVIKPITSDMLVEDILLMP